MAFTDTEKEFLAYCERNEFIPSAKLEEYRNKLLQENNLSTYSYALRNFRIENCPKCNSSGAYKWHFLGKLNHSQCGKSWYVKPGTYIGAQLKAVFRTGAEMGGDMAENAAKKGQKGTAEAIFGFLMGAAVRFPFAVLMIPIQAAVSLSQKKN